MILIKGRSHQGFHLGQSCGRVYDQVLLKSLLQVFRWSLFILLGGGGGGQDQEAPGPLLACDLGTFLLL